MQWCFGGHIKKMLCWEHKLLYNWPILCNGILWKVFFIGSCWELVLTAPEKKRGRMTRELTAPTLVQLQSPPTNDHLNSQLLFDYICTVFIKTASKLALIYLTSQGPNILLLYNIPNYSGIRTDREANLKYRCSVSNVYIFNLIVYTK